MGRIWHYKLIPFLSDDFIRELRSDLVKIIRDWQIKGLTDNPRQNLLLRQYPGDVKQYLKMVYDEYEKRFGEKKRVNLNKIYLELQDFLTRCESLYLDYYKYAPDTFFEKWHTDEYLEICMIELYERSKYAYGSNKVVNKEWNYYQRMYKKITGHDFQLNLVDQPRQDLL